MDNKEKDFSDDDTVSELNDAIENLKINNKQSLSSSTSGLSTPDPVLSVISNLFESFIDQFLENLSVKTNLSKELLLEEWKNLSVKSVPETVPSPHKKLELTPPTFNCTPKIPLVENKECLATLKTGPNKGKICGIKVVPGTNMCKRHTK